MPKQKIKRKWYTNDKTEILINIELVSTLSIDFHPGRLPQSDETKQKYSRAIKASWARKSKEEMDLFKQKLQTVWQNKSIAELTAHAEQIKNSWKQKPKEELAKFAQKKSDYMLSRTEDEIARTVQKWRNTVSNRSEEEKQQSRLLAIQTKNNWTEEQKKEYSKKLSDAYQLKPEQEKEKIRNKQRLHHLKRLYQNVPDNLENLDHTQLVPKEELNTFISKICKTKDKNNSFNTSRIEEKFYNYLRTVFEESDIFRQYLDDRYPFYCDFYIKSLDLFIELNISWTHGGHSFDADNINDQKQLLYWQQRALKSAYYQNAITTWTIRDVKKMAAAKMNNLNYKIYWLQSEVLNEIKNKTLGLKEGAFK